MTVFTKVYDNNGYETFHSGYDVNVISIIAESKSRENLIKEKGAKYACDGIPVFAKELLKAIDEDEDSIERATYNLILMIWLVESIYMNLKKEKFVKSDINIEILPDGTVKYTLSDMVEK